MSRLDLPITRYVEFVGGFLMCSVYHSYGLGYSIASLVALTIISGIVLGAERARLIDRIRSGEVEIA
jgi:hypothetical protein